MNIFTKTQEIIKPVVSINENNNKVFNIHLNPNNIDLNANTHNDMTYQFNFDSLDKGKYKLTFSYVGIFQRYRSLRVMSLNEIYGGRPYIFCDLGQLSNTFMPDDSDRCNNSFLLGYLQQREDPVVSYQTSTGNQNRTGWDVNFWNASDQNNAPIILNSRPSGNQIKIQINMFNYTDKEFEPYKISNNRYEGNDGKYIKDYSMILHFELLEEF